MANIDINHELARASGPLKPGFGLSGDVHCLSKTQQHTLADALKSLKQGVMGSFGGTAVPMATTIGFSPL